MLAFFPWLNLGEEPIQLGDFELLPFRRGTMPAAGNPALQEVVDAAFAPFFAFHEVRINVATVLRVREHGLTEDLSEEEMEQAFLFGDLLPFAGLAKRAFFEPFHAFGYCNTDDFRLYVQSFTAFPDGSAVTTRQRDGRTLSRVTRDAYRVYAPPHVSPHDPRIELDLELLRALLAARADPSWDRFEEAIFWFNRANTDSDDMREQAEAVMMVGAFERVFDLVHGNEMELAEAFTRALVPAPELPTAQAARIPAGRFPDMPVRAAWLRDFFRARSDPAHGRRAARYPSLWPLHEHLLLGAYAFPLVVKTLLERVGLYAMTRDDRERIDLFERLASVDAFSVVVDEQQPNRRERAWSRVREEFMWKEVRQEIERDLDQRRQGGEIT